MPITSDYKTDVGQSRPHNEDYVWVDEDAGIFIVADGMGGHEAGETASLITATTAANSMREDIARQMEPIAGSVIKRLMFKALESSNQAVLAEANRDGQSRKMGATIVMSYVRSPYIYICHAGDARAYLARENQLTQLTQDDSFVAELVAAGVISNDEAKNHPYLPIVTQAVGQEQPLEPTFTELTLAPHDWIVLCSDGLTGMIDEDMILAHLQQANGDPTVVVESLTQAANEAGGTDNISVIAICVSPD
ncbi:MAG: protein phosphatase 2C domain-containing protein [Chloroflexota bacterium]